MKAEMLNPVKEGRGRLLDEICSLCGYERKYAIEVLGGARPIAAARGTKRGGSKPKYGKEERKVFQVIWIGGRATLRQADEGEGEGEGLHSALGEAHGKLGAQVRPAPNDRLLAPSSFRYGKSHCATRPGSLLRSQIPVRTEHWDEEGSGFVEADTVAYCGGDKNRKRAVRETQSCDDGQQRRERRPRAGNGRYRCSHGRGWN
jgi:hypothetical protein